ncbi:EF hand domain-containing protein, variant 1 [Blastomyces dermatitidis ER-3]|uniref:EF hand domain-containing protein n=4 Tax=Ajellomyces dermatitidis TaxID=5039 RepID=F2T1K5_AJEDA|nr:EF hand domain-containing protein [Blastomyces dermatitidis ER-3]XP_045280525.1 EF hand domain-containing protein, variant 1 [Blastomyces dermatitidis ER-3]EGE77339.2 EF hand domain-containing protein [Blastomyces dermatitidis ATCC 18188]OAT00797.1 EF hand domain-containing protein [Blastomyces dermatitidis ER-3]OAT00798.1 EF hand domain-containing protein, variant 1 [Blastomyces dermatitidis ER-3]
MAYKGAYNPDALPAHAEPEQVAQMLGEMSARQDPNRERPPMPPPKNGPPPQQTRISPTQRPEPHSQIPTQHSYARTGSGGGPGVVPPGAVQATAGQYGGRGAPISSTSGRLYSPPPRNYGFGPPPAHPAQNRPTPTCGPPRSPQPSGPGLPQSDDPKELFPLFRAANASNSGALSETELGSALVNADYTSFDAYTVKMMIRMFDKDGSGSVGFDEFVALWRFLAAWRELFERFDEDRSGRISLAEFSKALIAFGYTLSPPFVGMIFSIFENRARNKGTPIPGQKDGMSFDLFVQACITLKRMTDVFKRYDDDRDGYITLGFEEFLTECLRLRE